MKLVFSIFLSLNLLLSFNTAYACGSTVNGLSPNELTINLVAFDLLDWNGGRKKKGTVTSVDLGIVTISDNGSGVTYVAINGSSLEIQPGSLVDFTATEELNSETGHLIAIEVSLTE